MSLTAKADSLLFREEFGEQGLLMQEKQKEVDDLESRLFDLKDAEFELQACPHAA